MSEKTEGVDIHSVLEGTEAAGVGADGEWDQGHREAPVELQVRVNEVRLEAIASDWNRPAGVVVTLSQQGYVQAARPPHPGHKHRI